ncbi:MAG: NYN domain-containing protein [Actinomycetota bacterium]
MPTNVYIDGFNFYYGAVRGTAYKWLDFAQLCRRLLPADEIRRIRYFTAIVGSLPNDPGAPQRQSVYLRALRTIPNLEIHLGQFRSHSVRMPLANPAATGPRTAQVIRTEEKGSDVNLASFLLLDAFERDCDTSVVISNDADLRLPIELVRRRLGLKVGIVNPHPARLRSQALQGDFFKQLRASAIAQCQFPVEMRDSAGVFRKPATW